MIVFSTAGATYTSLARRARCRGVQKSQGLKARSIDRAFSPRISHRSGPGAAPQAGIGRTFGAALFFLAVFSGAAFSGAAFSGAASVYGAEPNVTVAPAEFTLNG